MNRQSPTESATLFAVGTQKKGNDGNKWTITVASNGVKRWTKSSVAKKSSVVNKIKKVCENPKHTKDSYSMMLKCNLKECLNAKAKDVKKVASINITSNKIAIGEFLYNMFPIAKGQHNIYQFNCALIIAPINTTASEIVEKDFVNTKQFVNVDGGMFGYFDEKKIDKIVNVLINLKKMKKSVSKGLFGSSLPKTNNNFSKKIINSLKNKKTDMVEITSHDFDGISNTEPEEIIGYLFGNGSGDGSYPIFKATGNIYMICDHKTCDELSRAHNE
jgi:hypothetical protein